MITDKIVKIVSAVVIVSISVSSCKTIKNTNKSSNYVTSDTLSADKKFEFKYQFFEANKYFMAGKYDLATSLFNGCLKIDSHSSATHYKLASIYMYAKEFNLAEEHAEKAVLYNNKNIWYLYMAASIYSQNNKIDKAKIAYNKLIEMEPKEIDFYFNLADIYLKDNDINGALKIYKNIEDIFGISEIVSLQKHKLYLAVNKRKEALNELVVLSKANPTNVEYKRLIADYYIKINSIDEAITIYNNILKDYPDDGFSHIGLAECYRKKGDLNMSFKELETAFDSDDVPSDIKFNLLLSIIQNFGNDKKVQDATFELTKILKNRYPADTDIKIIYANFLLQYNKLKEAKDVLNEVVETKKDKYALWEQLIMLDNEFSDWSGMFDHSAEALKYFPNQSFLYFFNGFSAFQLEKYDVSVKSLSFGFKLITKDDPLYNDFMTFLAESYHKTNDYEKSFEYFDKIIKLNPDNVAILNNYAYYLSEKDMELEKAEKMSKITITKEPNNATYLDTYAWILFRLKKYDEALIYITKTIENDDDASDVVLEHYGDILYNNNKIDEAVVQWKLAKLKGEGSGLLDKKISNKAYYE